jgi:hypothetical protein
MSVDISYLPEWRHPAWNDDEPGRPAWFVTCSAHPNLGKDQAGVPWGYAKSGVAQTVKTRHHNAFHREVR